MTIRTAIVGVGNCAKSLVEGIGFYTSHPNECTGLMRPLVGPYQIRDIQVVAAFDIDKRKVGRTLDEALGSEPNNTRELFPIPPTSVTVQRGPTEDGLIPELARYYIYESDIQPVDISAALLEAQAEILVNYLPTGSNKAARSYAEAALAAGCSFINCMPSRIAKDIELRNRFASAGLILLGDDIKSQCGATILNRVLLQFLISRGLRMKTSKQTNRGGNADHFNLQFRPHDKEICKEDALRSLTRQSNLACYVHMEYAESYYDHKRALISITAEAFALAPISIELVLEDEDSPNSAGVVVDAIRAARVLQDAGRPRQAVDVSAALMKSPPEQFEEEEARLRFDTAISEAMAASRSRY